MTAEQSIVLPNSLAVQFTEGQSEPLIAGWESIHWSLVDTGPIHGAILIERTRTFGSKLIDLRWNVERLIAGSKTIGFTEDTIVKWYLKACELLIDINRSAMKAQDASVVILFSPIEANGYLSWKSIGYLAPIPYERLKHWYEYGCPLRTTTVGLISNRTFPTSIKHRSRIHYWLADRLAKKSANHGVGLLTDDQHRIGDCSVANLILVGQDGDWFTPDDEYSHHGTTLRQSIEMLATVGQSVHSRPVAYEEAVNCQEIIMVGSTGVVWPASSLDETAMTNNRAQCLRLQSLWKKKLDYDFISI